MGKAFITGGKIRMSIPSKLPPVGTSLNDCTWEEISNVAAKGLAREYFSVGDTKNVHIKGTVGTQAFDTIVNVFILGFDHNGADNTIDFGFLKTNPPSGYDNVLTDAHYNTYRTDGTKGFNLNHWGNSNLGGWKGCDLRYDVLGSTDVQPQGYGSLKTSTNRTGYDATTNCPINPVANTLMAALPVDLRTVMKPMTIYTNNVGGSSGVADDNVSASVDYLPLLGEFEVLGVISKSNSTEKNYQKRYDYFSAGNSIFRNGLGRGSDGAYWWFRSPESSSTTHFCFVSNNGASGSSNSYYCNGLAPIFRV